MASSSGDLTSGGGGGGASASTTTKTKPLTMFYNGGVAVFHLPQDKAEVVMKMAADEDGGDDDGGHHQRPNHGDEMLAKLRQGMPVASKIWVKYGANSKPVCGARTHLVRRERIEREEGKVDGCMGLDHQRLMATKLMMTRKAQL